MLSNLNPASQRFLLDLNRIQLRTTTAQQQLSSGLKVQSASDAPDQIGALLQLESELAANKQTQTNLGRVQTEVNGADNALTTAVQLVDKITQLAGQGLSADNAQSRASYASQIQDLQQQLVGLTSTSVEGRYIFDGGDGSGPPYQYDSTAVNGAVRLRTTAATRLVQDSSGSSFPYALSAQDIFDHRDASDNPAPDNILAAVSSAITALNANNTAGVSTAVDSLHVASGYLGVQQSFYGTVQNHLTTAINGTQSLDVSLKSQISAIRDADLVQASLNLAQGTTQQQAALAAEAKSQTKSLFDYLA